MKAPVLHRPRPRAHPALTQTLKVQKVSPAEMAELHKQGLCYYCDEKYSPGHKCREEKFFQIDASASSEDILSDEAPPSNHVEAPVVNPMEP